MRKHTNRGNGVYHYWSPLVTLVAAVHYFYMQEVLGHPGGLTVCRYIDWLITVPLQMVNSVDTFYLGATAAGSNCSSLSCMLGGYFPENGVVDAILSLSEWWAGYISCLLCWRSWPASATGGAVTSAFAPALDCHIGWSICPLGYVLFASAGTVGQHPTDYNIADFVNKIAFGLMIWAAAIEEA